MTLVLKTQAEYGMQLPGFNLQMELQIIIIRVLIHCSRGPVLWMCHKIQLGSKMQKRDLLMQVFLLPSPFLHFPPSGNMSKQNFPAH